MRIAIVNRVFDRSAGGAESYAVAIAEQLAQRHEIHIFAQQTDQPVKGVAYHRVFCLCQKPRWVNQLLFAMATWWATRRGFDVVHSHENIWHGQVQTIHVRPLRFNLLQGRKGVQLARVWLKVVLSPRLVTYIWLEGARFRPQPGRSVVATSDALLQECVSAYPQAKQMLSVILPGTYLPDRSTTTADARAQARTQLRLPLDKPLVLLVANDYQRKGLDVLLKALAQLPTAVHLAVAGNPAQITHYRPLTEKLGLSERVHFLGSQRDLAPAYWAADVLAHPTLEDSYAMVVLEAMAHGLPVVVSGPRYCGISADLQDGREALLLPNPRNAAQLALLLSRVLAQSELAKSLIQSGLDFARRHGWEQAAHAYDVLYKRVASR